MTGLFSILPRNGFKNRLLPIDVVFKTTSIHPPLRAQQHLIVAAFLSWWRYKLLSHSGSSSFTHILSIFTRRGCYDLLAIQSSRSIER
jgi:hypothetical protein